MTPMSWFTILWGKLSSVIWTLGLILVSTMPGYAVMWWIKQDMGSQIYRVMICLLLTAMFSLVVGAFVSSLFRRTAIATTVAFSVLVSWYTIPMLIWLGRDAPFGHDTVEFALQLSPLAAALNVMESPGFANYDLLPNAWYISSGLTIVVFTALAFQTWRLTRPQ